MNENRYSCIATASFGVESLVRAELEGLGIQDARTEDRRVSFEGSARDIARCNLRLRTADRVLIRLADFPADNFNALYEGVRSLPWRDMLAASPAVAVSARSVKSRLSAPSLQSITKKAIIDALSGRGPRSSARMEETGPRYDVELVINRDRASVCLDTTGPGLHKRGYRTAGGEAPLRENLAAALVLLSRWEESRPFADPLCGSGTIAIEAALIAANIAPGIRRTFAAEAWPVLSAQSWKEAREEARGEERRGVQPTITGSDRDARIVQAAVENARAAGVADLIRFHPASLEDFTPDGDYGCMVCNPPYGERLGSRRDAEALYRAAGALFRTLPTWSFFALTASDDFQKLFGARASRNRKLYNGNIRCWYYQYFGPLPRAGATRSAE